MQPPVPPAAGAALPFGAGGVVPPPPLLPHPLLHPPPPINAAPRTYRAFYTNGNNDPYRGDYLDVLDYFQLPAAGGNIPTPQEVAVRVYHAVTHEPISFLMLCCDKANAAGNDPGLVRVFHRAAMYFPNMGRESPWDNRTFAFVGDLVGQQIQTVMLPLDIFHQVAIFTIPNELNLPALFAADPNAELVGPFANNDPDTNPLRT